ncbi:MAG: 2-hydroxyacid dehydrogenase [Candidatus Bathyarchaeota archaeon]|nr:2-hydroxyacid dehydrogenase [Candidatus Bathyarchaeota archaeon]
MNILYVGSIPHLIREELSLRLPHGFALTFLDDVSDVRTRVERLRMTDFLLGFPRGFGEEMKIMTHLKLVQLLSAGYDRFNIDAATQLGILVANNGGANKIAVAEHTILLILALYKKLCKHHSELKNGVWLREKDHPLRLFELAGKNVGLLGFGNVGKALAKRLMGFETNISYFDVVRYTVEEKELNIHYLPLDELLMWSDIVSIHVPLLKTTKNLIGKKELDLMKSSAILINTARGEIVDEESLYTALKNNKIAGVGLDVFTQENEIQRGEYASSLFTLDNVVISPHYAGHTYDTWLRRIEMGYQNIVRIANGEEPLYVVNKDVLHSKEKRCE